MPNCQLGIVYTLAEADVHGKKLFLEYEEVDGIELDDDAPIVKFSYFYLNLAKTHFSGYRNIFRVFCPI